MFNREAEKTTASLILVGAPLTTLFLVTETVTDPVNATKFLIAGGLGFALLFVFLNFNLRSNIRNFWPYILALVLFNLSSLNAVLQSQSPLAQNLYGVYGRNTGLIAYLVLSFIAVGVLNIKDVKNFRKLIFGLSFAGIVNVLYCAWVLAFGDFLSWSNPYGKILGFFGNPDFISAFLGIFISTLFAYSFSINLSWKIRFLSLLIGVLAFYEIHRSHAIQGTAVTLAGLGFVGFYLVRSKFKSKLLTATYLAVSFILGIVALFGTLQKGPFSFVYKKSVSLRGTYWRSAINMGSDHPFSGVGMDSYGDWYRRARPPIALVDTPGPGTVTNAAHNVVLDFFAYGGWPLLLSYLAILSFGAIAILKVTLRQKTYDGVFVSMAAAWMCYHLQSAISINQIGLAIWGWLLTGALIAYEFVTRPTSDKLANLNTAPKKNSSIVSPQLVAGLGMVIGLIVACPPVSADSKWRSALDAKNGAQVLETLKPSYLTPGDTQRFTQAAQLFANSNLANEALKITLDAVSFNPDSFDNWRNLYFLMNSTPEEKKLALINMKRLDPLNPDLTKP